ncbi:MAG: VWA domain-containing protein [Planctomycetes bacterium]|nr:VWA domain-containing protein [Planctomycetota bacterium]
MSPHDLFAWPEATPFLLAMPMVWVLLHEIDRARKKRLKAVLGARAPLLAATLSRSRRTAQRRLLAAGLLAALIALMQPLWGEGLRKIKQRGVDLLVCLDLSQSMLARDLLPSRLERAKSELCVLADRARGDRIGLVAFAGEARLIVPLTRDMDSLMELVDLTGPLTVERSGTDLGAALEAALDALQGQTGDHEAILLLTDGEDLEERGLEAAGHCRERNIRVHCVGFGSSRGSKIAVESDEGESFLRDSSGSEVVSAMDPASLRRIAETTGGEFLEAGTRSRPLLQLYEKRIVPMARKSFDTAGLRERKNRFQWPLMVAFLLWISAFGLTDRKRS